ncbi:hypothetical protein BN129_2127 [Cronobacter sakazakii 701]|nr:hypothetical protein BN129_2127 [Cronobacter sakazakii 701]
MTSAGANVILYFRGDKRHAGSLKEIFSSCFFLKKQLKRN